jgi:hypothetical protein
MPIQGPVVPPIVCPPEKPVVLGRSSQADVQLSDQVVSRQHCKIENRGETWLITDLDSRHGTYINGIRLNVNEQTPLHMGDRVRLGPWTFRAMSGDGGEGGFLAISDDRDTGSSKVQEVSPQELSIRAEARLDLLIEASAAISAARNEEELANATLGALVSGAAATHFLTRGYPVNRVRKLAMLISGLMHTNTSWTACLLHRILANAWPNLGSMLLATPIPMATPSMAVATPGFGAIG